MLCIRSFCLEGIPLQFSSSHSWYIHSILSSIDPGQFGFIPGSSTTFALISMLHHWLRATDGSTVRTALLDHRKAFDLVDHHLLIAKLFSLGVKPTTVNWIIDFLRDRQQRVKLNNNCYSSWLHVPVGVSQGTRLGPWLFLVMINDLKLEGESFGGSRLLTTQLFQRWCQSLGKAYYRKKSITFPDGLTIISSN